MTAEHKIGQEEVLERLTTKQKLRIETLLSQAKNSKRNKADAAFSAGLQIRAIFNMELGISNPDINLEILDLGPDVNPFKKSLFIAGLEGKTLQEVLELLVNQTN